MHLLRKLIIFLVAGACASAFAQPLANRGATVAVGGVANGTTGGSPGGSNGDWQYNNAGVLGGFTPGAGVQAWVTDPTGAKLATALLSPLTVPGGGTGLAVGTSGGVLYFSDTTTMASSALLASNAMLLGGGAGAAPKTAGGFTTDGTSVLTLGVAGTSVGGLGFKNATSGTITVQPITGALGTITLSLPASTGVLTSGPSTTTNTGIPRWSGTAGGILLDSGVLIDGSNNVTTTGSITTGSGGSVAGSFTSIEGTAPSLTANAYSIYSPADVAAGGLAYVLPAAAASGIMKATNSSGVMTISHVAAPSGAIVGTTDVQTLSDKWIPARVTSLTSSATPTYNTDTCDVVNITALAAAITSMTSSRTGTLGEAQQVEFRIKDNGTARAITWGADFASGIATLPTTTILGKTLYVYTEFDTVTGDLMCQATGSYP